MLRESGRPERRADVSALEAEIDRVVYSLYGLTGDEIRIVEEATIGVGVGDADL